MVKKAILLFIFAALAVCTGAQTQSGFVKTRGRMVNGKHVPGQGLTGATVQIKGRASVVVKNNNGSFSFPVTTKSFLIQSVKKNGYQLVDADAAPKTYPYSNAPLYLIMETPAQQMEDKLAAERKLRRTLTKQLQQREDEIEELREQNRISQDEYNNTLQQLYSQQQSNDQLISEMADYYSKIDYDQIDDFNRRVSEFILSGELSRADSLLRSKGNIDDRIKKLNEHHDANVQARESLEKSEQAERFNREDLAQDCYSFFRRFVLDNQPDSAMSYIEKRAGLDVNNGQWQADAGSYLQKRGLLERAYQYYDRALASCRKMAQDDPEKYSPLLAKTLNNIAVLYSGAENGLDDARTLYEEALSLFKRLSSEDASTYSPNVASTLNNLAILNYRGAQDLGMVEPLLNQALDIYQGLSVENPEIYKPEMASICNNLALIYGEANRFGDSEKAFKQAIEIYQQLSDGSHAYDQDYAAALNNFSAMYFSNATNLYDSQELLAQAIDIYRDLANDDPQRFAPMLAVTLNNSSVQNFAMNRMKEGEKAFNESLDIYRTLVGNSPKSYLPVLGRGLYEQAIRYYQNDDLEKSEAFFKESLDAYKELTSKGNSQYLPEVAKLLRNLANVCDKRQSWAEAGKLYQEELEINNKLAMDMPDEYKSHVARSYGNLSNHAILVKDFAKAADYARKGLAIDESRLFIQANLAASLLFMGQTEQAKEIYKKYRKELRETFLDDFKQFEELGVIPAEARESVKSIIQLINQ